MGVLVFLASGILEDGSVAFFHMNLQAFLKQNCFFSGSVGFFGFRHFGRRFGGLFHMNLQAFLKQNCYFNESVCFLGFRHFGRRFCGLFSHEFKSFFETELFFQ